LGVEAEAVARVDPIAYAIDRTQVSFSEQELKNGKSRAKDRFQKAESDYFKLSNEPLQWRDRALRKYPWLVQFLNDE
jgi:hypothetical protein